MLRRLLATAASVVRRNGTSGKLPSRHRPSVNSWSKAVGWLGWSFHREAARRNRTIRRLAQEGRWAALLRLSEDPRHLAEDSAIVPLRLVAALESGDEAALERMLAWCHGASLEPELRIGLASRLVTWGRPEAAWRLLAEAGDLPASAYLSTISHRIATKTMDPEVRAASLARARQIIGPTITAAEPIEAVFDFPYEEAGDRSLDNGFSLTIDRGERVPEAHAHTYQQLIDRFGEGIVRARAPRICEFTDVFVNRLGQVWRNEGELVRSGGRPHPNLGAAACRAEFDEAVLCTNATRGLYHWLVERFSLLSWRLAPGAPRIPILFGSHAAAFQDETMRLVGCAPDEIARVGDIAYCRKVYIAEGSLAALGQWGRFRRTYERLIAAAEAEAGELEIYPMIYVSRRDTTRRVMANEALLEERLAALGVKSLVFSELSLAAQIRIYRTARLVIGAHGAGLTHGIIAPPGLRVLELSPASAGYHSLRFNYVRISRMRGHRHTLWLEPINPVTRDWAVDVDGVTAAAARLAEDIAA